MEALSGLAEGWAQRDVPTESITVTTECLDDHLPDGWLPNFVKIDVEGAERLVLEGAMQTFSVAKPTIAFEHGWHGFEDRERSEPIFRLLCEDLGLRLFDVDGNGPLELSDLRRRTQDPLELGGARIGRRPRGWASSEPGHLAPSVRGRRGHPDARVRRVRR
jgi:Methyltransferase FkbM domain